MAMVAKQTGSGLPGLIETFHAVLRDRGFLIFGWLDDLSSDPAGAFSPLFDHSGFLGLPARPSFAETTVLDLYVAA